ncbi:MAG: hypothetical protein E7163_02245 [Firmicutes bacterium]|nr:hypothetical protein [Bacillota bacterium]
MLKKLLKYDLKYMIKSMIIFYVLAVFFAVLTRIFFSLKQTVMIDIIGQVCVGTMFSMIASTLINTLMRSWVRFKDSIFGDESYLTHTLPVSKNNIYQSRFLITFFYLLIGLGVVLLSLFIVYYTPERWAMLKLLLTGISGTLNISTLALVLTFIIIIFLELLYSIQAGFLGLILGHKKNNNKIAYSVLFGFITYILSQVLVVISLLLLGIFNKDIMLLFTTNTINNIDALKTIVAFAIAIYIGINIAINYIAVKSLNKGVNIE